MIKFGFILEIFPGQSSGKMALTKIVLMQLARNSSQKPMAILMIVAILCLRKVQEKCRRRFDDEDDSLKIARKTACNFKHCLVLLKDMFFEMLPSSDSLFVPTENGM